MSVGGKPDSESEPLLRKWLPLISVMMVVFGSWLNAQGGWIKDFAQYDTVNLPLLFITFSTSGTAWYAVGITEDITGLLLNVSGIYLLRRVFKDRFSGMIVRPYFIVTIAVYLAFDFISYYFFLQYNSGSVSLANYGYVWNDSEYFVMLPMLFLSDIIMFFYSGRQHHSLNQRENFPAGPSR